MAFPSIRSHTGTNGTTATATPVVNLPATIQQGDTIFVVIRNAAAGAISWPGGAGVWNELADGSPDASVGQTAFAWKKADGTEGGTTITLSSGNGKFAAYAWAVASAADPTIRPPEISTVAVGTTGEPNATAVTPTGGAKDYLWLTFFTMEGEQTGITSYPTNYTLGQSGLANSGVAGAVTTNATVAGAARTNNAASEDAGVWDVTGTLDDSSAWTVAFHPEVIITPSSPPSEASKLTDTVTAVLVTVLLTGSATEPVKIGTDGRVDLMGLGNPIRITDGPVSAQLVSGGLSRLIDGESVKIADNLSVSITPIFTTVAEFLRVADEGEVELSKDETIKISDAVTAALTGNDRAASLSETLKLADNVQVTLNPEQTNLAENLKLADIVLTTLDPEQTSPGESLKIADTPQITINPEQATPSESLKISDSPQITINPEQATPSESLKIVDSPLVTLNPEQTSQSENVKIVDQVQASLGGLAVSVADENLKISDSVSVTLNPEQTAFAENVKIADVANVTLNPEEISIGENIKIADTISILLNPEEISFTENVKIADSVSVALIAAGALAVSLEENVKVSEDSTISVTPEFATLTEPVKVSDQVTAAVVDLDISRQINESLKISDQITAVIQLGRQSANENVKISDSVSAALQLAVQITDEQIKIVDIDPLTRLNPIQTTLSESLKVQDQLSIASGTTLSAVLSESLKITEQLSNSLDPEEASLGESSKASEVLVITLDPEEAALTEALGITDTIQVSLDPLEVSIDENIEIEDQAPRFGGPRVIDLAGGYTTILDVVGGYSGQIIDLIGGYGEGE